MTFVEYRGIGEEWSRYITQPITLLPHNVTTPLVRYVIRGFLVDGKPALVVEPSSTFTVHIVEPIYDTYFLVNITGNSPILVNETRGNYTGYVKDGSVLAIRMPTVTLLLNVTQPISLGITYIGPRESQTWLYASTATVFAVMILLMNHNTTRRGGSA
jgi:hypothetical protein